MQLGPSANWYFVIVLGAIVIAGLVSLAAQAWAAAAVFGVLALISLCLLFYRWAQARDIEHTAPEGQGRSY